MIKLVDGLRAKHIHPVELNKLWARAALMCAGASPPLPLWRLGSSAVAHGGFVCRAALFMCAHWRYQF